MILYLIPAVLIVLSVIALGYVVIKNLPKLKIINVESMPKEKETKVRNRIMLDRLSRKLISVKKTSQKLAAPMVKKVSIKANKFYQRMIDLEKKTLENQPLKKIDVTQKINDDLAVIEKLISEKNYDQAEEMCIDILRLDEKNLDVYEHMSEIYIAQRDYKKARETSRFLLKLLQKHGAETDKHRLANCFTNLGGIYQLENRNTFALTNYQKAVELEPNNPRFLDLLLKISIILKNKNLASQVFNTLKEADPDNQKLPEIKDEIDNIADQPAPPAGQ
ncbi:MAG: hypothetical protein PHW95_00330 [Patescibacteria group bacterium]|nr:hypothetical protein [Patescibacteria group bacterium]